MAKRRRSRPAGPSRAVGRTHVPEATPTGRGSSRTSPAVLAGIAVVALGVIIGGFVMGLNGSSGPSPSPPASAAPTGSSSPTPGSSVVSPATGDPTIDGVSCDSLEHTDFHIHAHLVIRVDGASQVIPANIGIHDTCLYWLHTHRDSGIIHVEAPADAELTLGVFFDIWGQPLTETQISGWTAGPGASVFAYVSGEPYTSDPRTIRLKDLENIELQVGAQPLDPLPFEFPPDFR